MTWNDVRSGSLISTLALLTLLGGCGVGNGSSNIAGTSALAVRVAGAHSFNPSISHGQIKLYRVTIEGSGIAEPIVAEFDGGAMEGVIEDVPSGNDRIVSVLAINANDVIIRAGEALDVHVGSGTSEVDVEMESVPIFTNLTDGNVIESSRLAMHIFADPDRLVVIDDIFDGVTGGLADAASGLNEINFDRSDGTGVLVPGNLALGKHTFVVRDIETSRKTSVEAFVVAGSRRPAPFVAAGFVSDGADGRVMPMISQWK